MSWDKWERDVDGCVMLSFCLGICKGEEMLVWVSKSDPDNRMIPDWHPKILPV